MFISIRLKLVAIWLLSCFAMISMFVVTLRDTHESYHLELRQAINRPLARLLFELSPGMSAEPSEVGRWQETLRQYAKINPEINAYLVDQNGEVIGSSSPLGDLKLRQVEILPIRQIADAAHLPLTGVDPLDPAHRKAISAVAVPGGYLYVVLRDPDSLSSAQQMQKRDRYLQGLWLVICWTVVAVLAGIVTVVLITGPIKQLNTVVDQFRSENFSGGSNAILHVLPSTNDEVGKLGRAIAEMSSRIANQMKEIEKNDTARRELFANISHDLRTPLTSLLGYLETIATAKTMSEEERHQYCGIAMQEARYLASLVDRLLELAKLDTPGATIPHGPFLMSELVASVMARFSRTGAEQGVALSAPPANLNQCVIGDAGLISRVLENLVENAFRHTKSGGKIGIELDVKGDEPAIVLTTTVWDTGTGISREDLPRIFDRFYRGETSRQATSDGAGLGLAICKRILELHNSTMVVESVVGQGSRFSFSLLITKSQNTRIVRVKSPASISFNDRLASSAATSEFA